MTETSSGKTLSREQSEKLMSILKARFEAHPNRHKEFKWNLVEEKLRGNPSKMWSLNEMERTGGEPDAVACDSDRDHFFMTALRNPQREGEASVTTTKHWMKGRNSGPGTVQKAWLNPWA